MPSSTSPAMVIVGIIHRPARTRHQGVRYLQQHHRGHQIGGDPGVHCCRIGLYQPRELAALRPALPEPGHFRMGRRAACRRGHLLRLHRLRRRLHRRARSQEPAARHADRNPGLIGDLHCALYCRVPGAHRDHQIHQPQCSGPDRRGHRLAGKVCGMASPHHQDRRHCRPFLGDSSDDVGPAPNLLRYVSRWTAAADFWRCPSEVPHPVAGYDSHRLDRDAGRRSLPHRPSGRAGLHRHLTGFRYCMPGRLCASVY